MCVTEGNGGSSEAACIPRERLAVEPWRESIAVTPGHLDVSQKETVVMINRRDSEPIHAKSPVSHSSYRYRVFNSEPIHAMLMLDNADMDSDKNVGSRITVPP